MPACQNPGRAGCTRRLQFGKSIITSAWAISGSMHSVTLMLHVYSDIIVEENVLNNQFSFNRANELFESLTSKSAGKGVVYRGHGDSKYELVPSFQRKGGKDKFLSLDDAGMLTASSWPFRIFYQTANQMGLSLPSVSNDKHENYTSESSIDALMDFTDEVEGEYDSDDLEIMAFAQHYRVPTPLLDWSRSPLVAMYFAASGALHALAGVARQHLSIDQVFDDQVLESVR